MSGADVIRETGFPKDGGAGLLGEGARNVDEIGRDREGVHVVRFILDKTGGGVVSRKVNTEKKLIARGGKAEQDEGGETKEKERWAGLRYAEHHYSSLLESLLLTSAGSVAMRQAKDTGRERSLRSWADARRVEREEISEQYCNTR